MKRFFIILATAILAIGASRISPPQKTSVKPVEVSREATSTAILTRETTAQVTHVIDGDTIEITGGARVRYIGMDTPELAKENVKQECFAAEASAINKTLILGKIVRMVPDISDTDKYGRLLRFVYVGDMFINDYLVRQGYARTEPVKPDVRYASQFFAAQQEAQKNNRGLWKDCVK